MSLKPSINVDEYRSLYPGLPMRAIKFFSKMNEVDKGLVPKSVEEFVFGFTGETGGHIPQPAPVNAICEKLCKAGYLTAMGAASIGGLNIGGLANRYICLYQEDPNEAAISRRLDCL